MVVVLSVVPPGVVVPVGCGASVGSGALGAGRGALSGLGTGMKMADGTDALIGARAGTFMAGAKASVTGAEAGANAGRTGAMAGAVLGAVLGTVLGAAVGGSMVEEGVGASARGAREGTELHMGPVANLVSACS
ncbi:hypothetical protein WJX72_006454 [[Myrmecia] bisecta]|uniref:Glycine zipper domain-containing protein n=1 Tax=[Myrmecia] bisecta TaxID=41462 RepID=A0AAW1P764_9CHLO